MKKIILALTCSLYAQILFANTTLQFKTQTINQTGKHPNYSIQINYPQILNPSSMSEKQFNLTAKKVALDKITIFKKSLSDWKTDQLPPEMQANGSSLTVTYDLATVDPNKAVSVRYSVDSYLAGAAHPSHVYSSLNYDLAHNKQLSLSELFQPHSNYLQKISGIATQKVTAQLKAEASGQQVDIFKDGLVPVAKNYAVWNLTPRGLKLTFNEYQVAAYVFGPQEIVIPYQQLTPIAGNSIVSPCFVSYCPITMQKTNS